MSYDEGIFEDEESLNEFLTESLRQYSRLAFGGKNDLIESLGENSGVVVEQSDTYEVILDKILSLSTDDFEEIFGKRGVYELAASYQFYQYLCGEFLDGGNDDNLKSYYNEVTGEDREINDSNSREYISEMVVQHSRDQLIEGWNEYAQGNNYLFSKYVTSYGHLTVGPLGFIFSQDEDSGTNINYFRSGSRWSRRMSILERILHPSSYEDRFSEDYPFNLEDSDMPYVFSEIADVLEESINELDDSSVYYSYLSEHTVFDINNPLDRSELSSHANEFAQNASSSTNINPLFSKMAHLSLLVSANQSLIRKLNDLIISGELRVDKRARCGSVFKITEDGIIDISRDNAVFDLAEDVSQLKSRSGLDSDINEEYIDIANNGVLNYLDNLANDDIEIYQELLHENNLQHEERHTMVADRTKVVLLENYGININLRTSFMARDDLSDFLLDIEDFENEYNTLDQRELVSRIVALLREARVHFERLLKEFFYIQSSLFIHYGRNKDDEDPFETNVPILERSGFRWRFVSSGIIRSNSGYESYINSLFENILPKIPEDTQTKVERFIDGEPPAFTLGDWYQLIKALENGPIGSGFWDSLPNQFSQDTRSISQEIDTFMRDHIGTLNTANHDGARTELRTDNQERADAIELITNLEEQFKEYYSFIPGPAKVINETIDVESNVTSYTIELATLRDENKTVYIYGSNIPDTINTFYVVPTDVTGDNYIYPILIENKIDEVF